VPAGTYSYQLTVYPEDDHGMPEAQPLKKALALKIKVVETVPKLTLKTATLQLNSLLRGTPDGAPDHEVAESGIKLSQAGYTLAGVQLVSEPAELQGLIRFAVDRHKQTLQASFVQTAEALGCPIKNGTYTFKFVPVVADAAGAETALEKSPVTVKIKVYQNAACSAAVSGKGKLQMSAPNEGITYTLTKLVNISGTPEAVSLTGDDADLFTITRGAEDAKGQPTFILRLKKGMMYDTKASYSIAINLVLEGITQTVQSKPIKLKVST